MLFWWMVAGLLVGEIVLLFLLMLPMPSLFTRGVVSLLDLINKPLYVCLAVMCWVLFDGTMEMQKYSVKPVDNSATAMHTENLYHKNKWRAERNFYLAAFTWTLLVILLRCHAQAKRNLDLEKERDELRAVHNANKEESKKDK